jgi:hypothetical protein
MTTFATPELYYDIADALDIPNEFITIDKAIANTIWFSTKAGATYSAHTVRDGKRLKKNSIRRD